MSEFNEVDMEVIQRMEDEEAAARKRRLERLDALLTDNNMIDLLRALEDTGGGNLAHAMRALARMYDGVYVGPYDAQAMYSKAGSLDLRRAGAKDRAARLKELGNAAHVLLEAERNGGLSAYLKRN